MTLGQPWGGRPLGFLPISRWSCSFACESVGELGQGHQVNHDVGCPVPTGEKTEGIGWKGTEQKGLLRQGKMLLPCGVAMSQSEGRGTPLLSAPNGGGEVSSSVEPVSHLGGSDRIVSWCLTLDGVDRVGQGSLLAT